MEQIEKEFHEKFKKLTEKEINKYDARWMISLPYLMRFYGGYHPVGNRSQDKKRRFYDYLYMYMLLHPNHDWDERHDQPIFAAAEKYAKRLPKIMVIKKERLRA